MPIGKCCWGIISHDNSQPSKLIIVQLDFIFTPCCLSLLMILSLADYNFLKIRGSVCDSSKFPPTTPSPVQGLWRSPSQGSRPISLCYSWSSWGPDIQSDLLRLQGSAVRKPEPQPKFYSHLSSLHPIMLTQLMSQVLAVTWVCAKHP